jgi:AcrR family transcriptional regulator
LPAPSEPGAASRRAAWLDLGLRLLAEHGPEALTIDRLCAAAGRTKGSYYHHFKDRDAFLDALMQRWRATATSALIEAASREKDAGRRGKRLDELTAALDHRVERGVRRLVAGEERLRPALEAVDAERIAYVAGIFRERLRITRQEALERAWIEHALFVGMEWLQPRPPDLAKRVRRRAAQLIRRPLQG